MTPRRKEAAGRLPSRSARFHYDHPMLPPPYKWRIEPDRAFLDWNYGNVANVQPRGKGWELSIRYQGIAVMAPCGSLRQGIRYAERWILARGADIPGLKWRGLRKTCTARFAKTS